eukprot:6910077-Pyramimonas_sp.AAC.1
MLTGPTGKSRTEPESSRDMAELATIGPASNVQSPFRGRQSPKISHLCAATIVPNAHCARTWRGRSPR